jgi:hypothetical protein
VKICLLKGHGPCRGKISGEHFISESLLRQLAKDGRVRIGGLPWQPDKTFQRIGLGSLKAKILCEGHNNGLSRLDSAASNLFRVIDGADKRPDDTPAETVISGPDVELWFLKALAGHEAAKDPRAIPDEWKRLLAGGAWPDLWGMYVADNANPRVLAPELLMETRVHPDSGQVLAASFSVAGVLFWLLLGRPDHPAAFGKRRPRGLIFTNLESETRIEFRWPFETEVAVYYRKVARTGETPPHWAEFSDEAG